MVGQRFRYSRWDGTQSGFDFDALDVLAELSDDLMYHGDPASALRRLMHDGFSDRDGRDIEGLREILRKLRSERQDQNLLQVWLVSPVACSGSLRHPAERLVRGLLRVLAVRVPECLDLELLAHGPSDLCRLQVLPVFLLVCLYYRQLQNGGLVLEHIR